MFTPRQGCRAYCTDEGVPTKELIDFEREKLNEDIDWVIFNFTGYPLSLLKNYSVVINLDVDFDFERVHVIFIKSESVWEVLNSLFEEGFIINYCQGHFLGLYRLYDFLKFNLE